MAILYRRYYPVEQAVEKRLKAAGIPLSTKRDVKLTQEQDTVKLITNQHLAAGNSPHLGLIEEAE